jgi:hypothetical protein
MLLQYANNKIKIKALEAENEMLQSQVQAEVEALIGPDSEQVALQELPGFSFSLAKARPKWQYSPTLQDVESDLKEMKKQEEANGKAINLNDGKRELRFNQPKN